MGASIQLDTTFLSFLKANHALELRLPPKQSSASARKALVKQMTQMVQGPRHVDKRWIILALRNFHHLSPAQAKTVHAAASSVDTSGGVALRLDGGVYWVPKPTTTLGSATRRGLLEMS